MPDLILDFFDVVVVPFPFTDRNAVKRRPALVLSSRAFSQKVQHSVLAMITSAGHSTWLSDHPIENLDAAGLPSECVIRLKLFTLDYRLVIRKAGALAMADQKKLRLAWKDVLAV